MESLKKKLYDEIRNDPKYQNAYGKRNSGINNNKFNYNNNLDSKDLTNLDRLKDSLLDMKNNLVETVQTLSVRESELSHSVEKAEDLKSKTDELLINARKAKKLEKENTPFKKIIPFVIGAIVVYCVFAIMCGGSSLPNCSV